MSFSTNLNGLLGSLQGTIHTAKCTVHIALYSAHFTIKFRVKNTGDDIVFTLYKMNFINDSSYYTA